MRALFRAIVWPILRLTKRTARLASILACAATLSVAAGFASASAPVFNMQGVTSASVDLDGDDLADRIQVSDRAGSSWLDILYGNGRSISCALGSSGTIELIKIGAADLTGNGMPDVVLLIKETGKGGKYGVQVISIGGDDYSLLQMPNSESDTAYRFSAVFARNYVLEIRSESGDFLTSIKLPESEFSEMYRPDGTAPDTLRAQITRFQDFTLKPARDGFALDLWQCVQDGATHKQIGSVVSTIVWRGGEAKLVGQRYEPK